VNPDDIEPPVDPGSLDRRTVLSLSGALAAAALAGCAGEESGSSTPTTADSTTTSDDGRDGTTDETTDDPGDTTDDGDGTTTEEPPRDPDVDERLLAELAADNAAFATDLHRHLADAEGGNQFVSPYSISVALAMTYAGARGETREQMAETLNYALGEDLHPAFDDMATALASRAVTEDPLDGEAVDAFQLSVANSLWAREGYSLAEDYLALVEAHYGAGLRRADFAGDPGGERQRINDWVAERTAGRIEDLLPPGSITAQTVLVLANAIYFMAGWLHEFDPEDTAEGTFGALDGSESTVPLMRQELRTNFARVQGARAVELPYVGEEVSMVLVVPDEGNFEAFERGLDADRLFGIFEELSDARGTVVLPRFEFETEVQLSETLAAMGMPAAFGAGADFGGMVPGDGSGPGIDEVFHKAFVSVDEEGTEAAAATAVVMAESAPPEFGEIRFDRPFLFCIRDRPTDAVLFLGRVVDAGQAQG